ncbi:hypothetical protein GCM10023088_57670 [Actinomadura verrucosospora]
MNSRVNMTACSRAPNSPSGARLIFSSERNAKVSDAESTPALGGRSPGVSRGPRTLSPATGWDVVISPASLTPR